MRFGSGVVLSVVACNLLMGANYTNWNNVNFNDGDTVTIDYNGAPTLLGQSISITNGKLTVTIDAISNNNNCGNIGCFTTNAEFQGGGLAEFILKAGQSAKNKPAFGIVNTKLTLTAGVKVGANDIGTIFKLNGGTLEVNSEFEISGAKQAIEANNSKVIIKPAVGKKVDVGGNISLNRSSLEIELSGANQKITGDLEGKSSSPMKITLGDKSKIIGSLTNSGDNTILNLNNSALITGKVTTGGAKDVISGTQGSKFQGGIQNKSGELDLDLNASKILGGVESAGTTTDILLDAKSTLQGGVNLSATTSTMVLQNESTSTNGDLIFAGTTNTLQILDTSSVVGQVIINRGTSSIDFKGQSKLEGGIDTSAGAGQSTILFKENAKLDGGTSNFNALTNLTLIDDAQTTSNTIINIHQSTSTINFENSAKMNGGEIHNQGGRLDLQFKNDTQMSNGTIQTSNGNTHLIAETNAQLSNFIKQSGGDSRVEFIDSAKFNGEISQSGGVSNTSFSDTTTMVGNITQSDGTSKIHFKNKTSLTGNISVSKGTTEIIFNDTAKITGNILAGGNKNTVTFTDGTLLDGNLTLDGVGPAVDGNSKATLTGTRVTGNILGYDRVDIAIERTEVEGWLHQDVSVTRPAMTSVIQDSWIKKGFEGRASSENTITMTNSQIDNAVKQLTGKLDLVSKQSVITGGFLGKDSENTIKTIRGSISGGVHQSKGTLDMINDHTSITGGFLGEKDSINTINSLKGSLEGGIKQDTGKLTLGSQETSYTGGFRGINSENDLEILRGDFNNGDFIQSGGSLKAQIVKLEQVNNITGDRGSENVIHIIGTEINDVTQDSGSLEFVTDSLVKGNVTGRNGSQNKISITGTQVQGEISQNTGSMRLELNDAEAQKNVQADGATSFGLNSINSTIKGNLSLNQVTLTSGTSSKLDLWGDFSQDGGKSELIFSNATFGKNTNGVITGGGTNLTNTNATLTFTNSHIQNIIASGGFSNITLDHSTMKKFNGFNGRHTFVLVSSTGETFTQSGGGFLGISGSNQTKIASVTGNNKSEISVNLNNAKVLGNVENNDGNTTINLQNAEIGGDVLQTGANMSFSATESKLKGKYQQTDGTINPLSLIKSQIDEGIVLRNITQGSLSFNQKSQVLKGLSSSNGSINFILLGQSQINGTPNKGIDQNGGEIIGIIDGVSKINDGLELRDGKTNLSLFNQSQINGDITADNNEVTILVDNSQINGNISVTGKFLHLTAQNNSIITSTQTQITNADLTLIVDTNSQFIGNLNQTGHKQDIQIKQDSTFQGSITNTDTTSKILINNATLTGSLTQTRGTLALEVSNKGIIGGNVTLDNVKETTLSGVGANNKISGDFKQEGGLLNGSMNGLTLKGTYTQIGGVSDVRFTNSNFEKDTSIEKANSSSLTFDRSILKNYTITGGLNNTLKLLNQSTLTGNLTLQDSSKSTLKMDNSTITGDILGINHSELHFDTQNSTIGGDIDFNTGGIKGQTSGTTINGDLILSDTNSEISFTQNTTIVGNATITGGDNTIKFDASQIQGGIRAEGGELKLDLSNGSKIGQDVMLIDSTTNLTGKPAGNEILGKFTTKASAATGKVSKLTGEISSLTLHGTFTQEFGESDIIFNENSLFKSLVSITDAVSAHLKFVGNSGIENAVTIFGGDKNQISLKQESFIKGNITTENQSDTIIKADSQSLIMGDLTSTNPKKTEVDLTNSSFDGNIKQTNGGFLLKASGSEISSSTTKAPYGLDLEGVTKGEIKLEEQSSYTTSIQAKNSTLAIDLLSQSNLNSLQTPQSASLENSNFTITAKNSSSVGLNLKQTSQDGSHALTMNFFSKSVFLGTMELSKLKSEMTFDDSKLLSNQITLNGGSLDLKFKNAKHDVHNENNPEVIHNFKTDGMVEVKIGAYGQSYTRILKANFLDSQITLESQNSSRLESPLVTLDGGSEAKYLAESNGILNLKTEVIDASLEVKMTGGILQGEITQENLNRTTKVNLGSGGRWAITADSQINSLSIQNSQGALSNGSIFLPVLGATPLSFVDFTMNFDDHDKSTRIGKELVAKPTPLPPNKPDHQTYVRTLETKNLDGDSGVFRVYVDLKTALADKIIADEADGNHFIQPYYRPETFKEGGGNEIVVAKVKDPNTQASFKGLQSEVGLTRYDTEIIKKNAKDGKGFEWVIGQVRQSGMSQSSKIIASILQSQYRTFSVEVDSLNRRIGGMANIQREQGLWARSFVGQGEQKAQGHSISSSDQYYSIWTGYDANFRGLTVHNFLGVFFNYTGLNTESKDYTAKSSNISFGAYNTFRAYSGFYLDLLAKYIYTMSEFEISNYSLARNRPKINNHKFLANLEMGYTFYLGEKRKSSYIEPQFQITSGFTQGIKMDFLDAGGANIAANLGWSIPVMMRWGVFYGKMFGEKIKSDLRIGTSLAYDVNSGGKLRFDDGQSTFKTEQKGDFRMIMSAHADFYFTDSLRAYASFDTSFFGNYSTLYNVNFGLRFIFGQRNDIVAPVPMVYSPYTPPPPPTSPRNVPVIQDYTTRDIDMNYQNKPRAIRPAPQMSPTYHNPAMMENYAPQPQQQQRKTYRDETIIISPNNPYQGGNQ